jgi:hypothetical protein
MTHSPTIRSTSHILEIPGGRLCYEVRGQSPLVALGRS